ncbi:POT family proton-dependent oligopeptide transporter [Mycolicibacterium mucogenicum 261Sha1.1M5]|uniref:peptide MFS transporter n=1 Tax=Leucobacter aridicollis TaxID=283878 RepID=UPI000EAD0D1A|nr:peptide MFS transporter [Leucobacter aridicollis]MCS3429354.1 POT family proton-dependent oligopeptide transporter [Leucobacter aridicollis]RKQ89665.1 POT family proton-dependent oligopeptide transporter [Mycolicibacterium mucogenicum 261Sha1.1M5]
MSSPTTQPDNTAPASQPQSRKGGFFGHPWGLANLAGVEMWERFSFYGMQALLAFYIYYSVTDGGLGMSQAAATSIVGAYGGLVYLSAVLGGWVADRVLGAERTLLTAACLIMAGHLALALVPGMLGLAIGLVGVALGSGSLKTTTSTVLGDLYDKGDQRRDAAFSIYYMGVNIGGFAGPLLTSALWGWKGFHWGFGLAAIGMAVGLVQYIAMRKHTVSESSRKPANPLSTTQKRIWSVVFLAAIALIALALSFGIITAENLSTVVVVLIVIAVVVLFTVILTSHQVSAPERRQVFSFIPLFLASAVFWSLSQQQFTVLAIYADQRLNRNIFGWEMPPSMVQSINPIFIIILAGVFAAMWVKLGDKQPSTPVKFAIGTALMGVAFLCFIPFAGGANGTVPFLAYVVIILLLTLAELSISPVGQSLATKLAPRAFHSQMVALFFLSISLGSAASGSLSRFYTPENEVPYFLALGGASIAVGAILFLLRKPVLRLMGGIR